MVVGFTHKRCESMQFHVDEKCILYIGLVSFSEDEFIV